MLIVYKSRAATAVQLAAATIMAGMADVIVAGGTESASTMPRMTKLAPRRPPTAARA